MGFWNWAKKKVVQFCNWVEDQLSSTPPVRSTSSAAEVSQASDQYRDVAQVMKEYVDARVQQLFAGGRKQRSDDEGERRRYRGKANRQAESAEEKCRQLVDEHFRQLMQELRRDEDLRHNGKTMFRELRQDNDALCDKIPGTMSDYINKKFSHDDDEFRRIMQIESGSARKVEINRFTEQVIRGATDRLADVVERALRNQAEDVEEYLDEYADGKKKKMVAQRESYEEMLTALQDGAQSAEKQIQIEQQADRLLAIADEVEKILA